MRTAEPPGRVVLLNGTSCAGKTTLARALQDESDVPFVYWGIDTLFDLVPPNWGGGRGGPLSREGFRYHRPGPTATGHPVLEIRTGPVGRRMVRSGQHAAAAFARGGDHVVIDEMLLSPDLMPAWLSALAGLTALLVRVDCPLEEAERRELARGNEPGLARGHYESVHDHGVPYDATVDTTTGTPAELARSVLDRAFDAW
ncbi:chloramphenicol phosphotransferase CPT family protein [Saccharothrix obliqua]|uniref:chloramphenicol phosphotransferase CPT family protein n=1 Tax=Saccharothrix obliqua TaxID=2861747 RepID=UPI001C5E9E5D|nr:chloramphenicol phosphotransferase CPT family protein [Saccharothrix obliqua]MBW4718359.1 chloramphenicol phosphotransferase CPT family protein [Saccharothrix obliqua]